MAFRKEKSDKLIGRVRRACQLRNCTVAELFDQAGHEAHVDPDAIKNALGAYNLGVNARSGKADPPKWFREYVNDIRKAKRKTEHHKKVVARQREQHHAAYT